MSTDQFCKVGTHIVPILQIGKPRLGENNYQSLTTNKWWYWDPKLGPFNFRVGAFSL